MKNPRRLARSSAFVCLAVLAVTITPPLVAENWPSFRGPQAAGRSAVAAPTDWDVESGRNVRWKTPIPGLAHASPVLWGDKLFVVTAVAASGEPELLTGLDGTPRAADDNGEQTWWVIALDRESGDVLWKQKAHDGVPTTKRHAKATHANSTPATDGTHVATIFGPSGLHVYTVDGKLVWQKDLGMLDAGSYMIPPFQWGFGNSPVIHDGKVIVQADVQKRGFLAVFDVEDGRELWRVAREEVPTWATPTVVSAGTAGAEIDQIVVNGYKHIGGYSLADGEVLWRMAGGGDVPVPTPVVGHEMVFITNAHGRQSPVYAVKLGARGDITLAEETTSNEHIAWAILRGGGYMQTPVLLGDELYVCRDNGVLGCFDAKTGTEHYRERIAPGSDAYTASAVAAADKLYFTSEVGDVVVVQAGTTFEVVARNTLDETTLASPAVADGVLYYRTRGHVLAIADAAGHTPASAPAREGTSRR